MGYVMSVLLALFHAGTMLWIWIRCAPNDRRNVVGHHPIAAIAIFQAMMWTHVSEGDTAESCSITNSRLSFMVTVAAHIMPVALSQRSWIGIMLGYNKSERIVRVVQEGRFINTIWAVLAVAATAGFMSYGYWPACTTLSESGNLVFPTPLFPNLATKYTDYNVGRYIMWWIYITCSLRAVGTNVAQGTSSIGFALWNLSLIPLLAYYRLDAEFMSVWTTVSVIVPFFYLIEPLQFENRFGLQMQMMRFDANLAEKEAKQKLDEEAAYAAGAEAGRTGKIPPEWEHLGFQSVAAAKEAFPDWNGGGPPVPEIIVSQPGGPAGVPKPAAACKTKCCEN